MSGKASGLLPRHKKIRARTVIFHGASDRKVHPTNAERIV